MDILKAREKARKLKEKGGKFEREALEERKSPPEEKPIIPEKTAIVFEEEKEVQEESFLELAEEELKHAFAEELTFEETEDYLVFTLSNENYAVKLDELKEVIKPRNITEVPGAPHYIKGIISLRGVILPIIDIRKKLNLPEERGEEATRFVLVETGGKQFGFQVDSIKDVKRIPKQKLEVPPPTMGHINREYISHFVHFDGNFIAVLNIEKLVEG